jgi:hypothetical protein
MNKTLICLLLSLILILSTTAAVFAVDYTGLSIGIDKKPIIVKPLVDYTGL